MGVVVVPFLFLTALLFLTLLGAALIYPKSVWAKMLAMCLVLLTPVWLMWDIPAGYIRFKTACKADAGFKVHAKNFRLANRVRLVGDAGNPEFLLARYPSIKQVEAEDKSLHHTIPTVYALYERDENGNLSSSLMDKVTNTKGHISLFESIPSQADYFIEKKFLILSDRMYRTSYSLRDSNYRLVAETVSYNYFTFSPSNQIFFSSHTCGPVGAGYFELEKLLPLIAANR